VILQASGLAKSCAFFRRLSDVERAVGYATYDDITRAGKRKGVKPLADCIRSAMEFARTILEKEEDHPKIREVALGILDIALNWHGHDPTRVFALCREMLGTWPRRCYKSKNPDGQKREDPYKGNIRVEPTGSLIRFDP